MALFKKTYASFGRDDKLSGVRALAKGDNFFIRLIAFALLAALFLLVVELTHKTPKMATEPSTPPPIESKPQKK